MCMAHIKFDADLMLDFMKKGMGLGPVGWR